MSAHHVVVVGAGFGGLETVHRLAGAPVQITIVDRRNHHLFQPLLYQAATASLAPSEIAWPIRHLFRRRSDVTTLLASVESIDKQARELRLDDGSTLRYDTLVLATGARHAYFGHDAWEPFAPGLKTLEDATTIRGRILLAFEEAERAIRRAEARGAFDLRHCRRRPDGRRACRHDRRAGARHAAHRVPPHRHAAGAHRVDRGRSARPSGFRRRPVNLRQAIRWSSWASRSCSRNQSRNAAPKGVVFGGKRLAAATIIWAAGVQSSPAAQWLDAPADRVGRLKVEPDLTVPGHPEIFAIGDAAIVLRPDGQPVPGIAPAAKQEGAYVAKVIRARLSGAPAPPPFRYKHAGDLATIGKRRAVIDFGWIKLRGALAWWLWGFAHIYFLIGVRNRLSVAINWLWIYARDQRGARLITWWGGEVEGTAPFPRGEQRARQSQAKRSQGHLIAGAASIV